MKKIAILADSGCQIELNQYEDQGIFIVPLCITMKNHTYLDQKEISSLEVFETMEKEDIMVMTSQPSTGELVDILQRIKDAGYEEVIGLPIAFHLIQFFLQSLLQCRESWNKAISNQQDHFVNFIFIVHMNGYIAFFQHQ